MITLETVATSTTPDQLQQSARDHNWDDGFQIPQAIADHPACDLAVALELFWLSEAITLLTNEIAPASDNIAWATFSQQLTARIIQGHYKPKSGTFKLGYSLSQLHSLRKLGIPEILFTDVVPSNA